MTGLVSDLSFRREVEALHALGPRVTGELLAELIRDHGPRVRTRLQRFADLDMEALREIDALLWPPLPLTLVK